MRTTDLNVFKADRGFFPSFFTLHLFKTITLINALFVFSRIKVLRWNKSGKPVDLSDLAFPVRPVRFNTNILQQKQNFQSLSCLRFNNEDCCQSNQTPPSFCSPAHPSKTAYPLGPKDDNSSVIDETNGDWTSGKEREPPWAELCGLRRDVLGGELDIEQIERN
ncbi:protein FAM53B isoform X2 [Tachysurus ichikawai]